MNTTVRVDHFTAIERQKVIVAKLLDKRAEAEHAHQQAEAELERLKAAARKEGL
jgi:hypothetical protein